MVSRILAFGHSHLGALQRAYEARAKTSAPQTEWRFKQLWGLYDPFVEFAGAQIRFNSALENDLLEMADQIGDDAVLVGSLLGSEHFLWSVQGQIRPFDIVLPFDDTLPTVPSAEMLPYSLAYRFAYETISTILSFNGRVQALTGRPIYQLLPPPPVADQERVLAYAPSPIRDKLLAVGVPHPVIRYKLWRLWVIVAEDVAKRDGIKLCDRPAAATDAAGMLLEDFCGDAVHGNEHYGLLEIQSFEELVG